MILHSSSQPRSQRLDLKNQVQHFRWRITAFHNYNILNSCLYVSYEDMYKGNLLTNHDVCEGSTQAYGVYYPSVEGHVINKKD